MLGTDSPGFRARVALVDHPEHGRSVCKIFRPGAMTFFRSGDPQPMLASQICPDFPAPPFFPVSAVIMVPVSTPTPATAIAQSIHERGAGEGSAIASPSR
jgi:hypothetical protein